MNKFTDLEDSELENVIKSETSIRKILIKVGYKETTINGSGIYKIFKNECSNRNIQYSEIIGVNVDEKEINYHKRKKKTNDEVFTENSTYARHRIKERIIKQELIEYKCNGCGITSEWNGKLLSLQLEHKNGINNDNRLENLTFLCPNCHSQTGTFSGKNNKKEKILFYCECGNEKNKHSSKCRTCSAKDKRTVERPSYEILIKDIEELGYSGTGRKYKVSDNSIRKWIKNYEK